MERRRVVITGLGVVANCGIGTQDFWAGLNGPGREGSVLRIEDFDPSPWFENPKAVRRADRFTQFAVAAADMALEQAGDPAGDPDRIGVMIGTGMGGLETLEAQIEVQRTRGSERVSPFLIPMLMPNAAAANVSMRRGYRGPCETTTTACAAGTHSVGNAARLIAHGRCDAVIAGGTESTLTETGIAGFENMTALTRAGISRPFDADRDGFVMSEGSAVLVLEALEHAQERGATPLGEVLGSASTADAHHITAPSPGGSGAVSCMELALADAGVQAGDVGHINAHGTSTPLNDAAEAEAIVKVFGADGPPVTSIKGVLGHALGAAGALEAAAVVLSLEHEQIPPTAHHVAAEDDLAPIDVVAGEPRSWAPAPVLSNSFGFGGHNGCLVIGPAPGQA
jgi:3-oxoacyl-[acyl-carrier-protein] synthase II